MKKEIRLVDKEKGILQVTTVSERWYGKQIENPDTGLPEYQFVPSVTWMCDFYPKGPEFIRWVASKGWDEAEAIKNAAGDKGSKVHLAIRDLIEGRTISIDAKYLNKSSGQEEDLTLEEYDCIMAFAKWHKDVSPQYDAWEFVVWGDGYAGTVDLTCKIDGQKYLIDFKTSQQVWPSHELQVSAYKHAGEFEDCKLAILQVGYNKNKNRYKFTEIDDQYPEFLATKLIWAKETKGQKPLQREYPLAIKLNDTKEK